MHAIQQSLFEQATNKGVWHFKSLRDLGRFLGNQYPQTVKHHLQQLEKKGLIQIDWDRNIIKLVKPDSNMNSGFFAIPVLGSANCGAATIFADEHPQGVLRVSKNLISRNRLENVFALRAVGSSMNRATVNNKDNIEDGDYVIVDKSDLNIRNGDYVLSVIDGSANIKKLYKDDVNNIVALESESSDLWHPILIHEEDRPDLYINGKVIGVIKSPKRAL